MQEEISGLNRRKGGELPFSFPCPWLYASLLLLSFFSSQGQNLICKQIPANKPTVLDTGIVEPFSIHVNAQYEWNDTTNLIHVFYPQDSVTVCYRTLSPLITQKYQNRHLSSYDERITYEKDLIQSSSVVQEELFDFEGIHKYGAISRGVSFGNRQNLFVNSTLNLQMDGKLDEDLFISAVITDQNIPYQPEGNTQQIRDFDNVFIKLYNDAFDVTAGDIVLQQPEESGYFLRYYKNVQGLRVGYQGASDNWQYESRVSGALSKGKFNSALLPAIEGINGPYKLRGPNGERFIIVLANSEKVFIDGKRMERGFDRDYVIDYNLGEITFNNHIIITQFTIIRVDFEYAEQFYSRSNLSAYQSVRNDKIRLYGNYYRERDNPSTNFGFNLTENDLAQLRNIGDQVDLAFVAGFDSVRFSENRILYAQKDTVDQDGNRQTIFEYSTDRNAALFSPSFSEVGPGNGNYVLRESTANGRIYEWVSPQNGQKQGNYEPGVFIPLPNSRQMMTVGGEAQLSTYEWVKAEMAFSNTDQNLYSSIGDEDNVGRAYYAAMQSKNRPSFIPDYKWVGSMSMEWDETDFTYIDRYRPILFDRDWNFTRQADDQSQDYMVFLKAGIEKNEANRWIASANRRKRADMIDGWQYQLDANEEFANIKFISSHFLLQNKQLNQDSRWIRSKSDVSFRKWKAAPGYIFEVDENEIARGDSVISTLMHYQAHEVYLSSTDSSQSTYRIGYQLRKDRLPVAGEMKDFLFSKNLKASYGYVGKAGSVSADVNYRGVEDKLGLNTGQDEIINGRINWIQSVFDGSLRSNLSYASGNARELRRAFVYVPVAVGEGTHTWRDTNGDGVQDLNEFFEAINPDERAYVKIFTPTDEYITSFQTFYQHTLDARFPIAWRSGGSIRQAVSRFSANVNFNINFKTTSNSYADRLNPFGVEVGLDDLVAARLNKRYTLFYNRNGRGLAGDFTYQNTDSRQLLIQGFELRQMKDWSGNVKVDISPAYTFRVSSGVSTMINQSDFLDSRNFKIVSYQYVPQLIWQPSNALRLVGSFERKSKRNEFVESSSEAALFNIYKGEVVWNKVGKGSLRGVFSVISIDFRGDASSYLGYLLLDALQPGSNQTWQIHWQQKLSKGMQLSLFYNGRKSEDASVVHTGNMQVTAFF